MLFEDQLRYLNYKKKFAEQPLGGWTDTADVTIPKQESKIKLDVKEIEQEIKEVKQQKELNLKYTDRKLLKKGRGYSSWFNKTRNYIIHVRIQNESVCFSV